MDEKINTKNAASSGKKRKTAMVLFTMLCIIIGIVWTAHWYLYGRFEQTTEDAYVNGNMVQLMSQIPGTVTSINADDTQLVQEGQVLLTFDPTDMTVALQSAEANLAEAVRNVRQLFETVKSAEAAVTLRQAELEKATSDLEKRRGLTGISAISKEDYAHYETAVKTAKAQYDASVYDLKRAEASVSKTDLEHQPLVMQAEANLTQAYLNEKRTVIMSPVTGYVAKRNVQVGQRVLVNTPMLSIIPLNQIWVDANYKESELSRLRIGQPVILHADAYPDVTYHGKIFGLNAGTGSAFSLLPPQNATGNWIKIIQRLPVRIEMDPRELEKHPLQLGLSMEVNTNTHDTKGVALAQSSPLKPLYQTVIYSKQLADANELIAKIIKDNAGASISKNEVK